MNVLCRTSVANVKKGAQWTSVRNMGQAIGIFDYEKSFQGAEENWREFPFHATSVGQDEYPFWRKEHMKKSEKRYNRARGKVGKLANYRVRGLVEFIEHKRKYKYT